MSAPLAPPADWPFAIYARANRLSIQLFGCSVESLSWRHPEPIQTLYAVASEDCQRAEERRRLGVYEERPPRAS